MKFGLLMANLLIFGACNPIVQHKNPPRAVNGVLDLTDWDFAKDGPADLSGEYEFYWKQLLAPEDFSHTSPPERSGFIHVPASWKGQKLLGERLPGIGYATYRLTVLLSDTLSGKLAFKFLDMSSAYTVFAYGKKILSVGAVGATAATSSPRYSPQITEPMPPSNRLELIFQVSNFHHARGGAWEPIRLGNKTQLVKIRARRLDLDLILFGSILIMGLYHLVLFRIRKSDTSLLLFSLFCLLVAIRILTTVEKVLLDTFPDMNWEAFVKVEYLSMYLAVPVFALFLHRLAPHNFHKLAISIIAGVGFPFAAPVCLTPARIFTHTLYAFQLFMLLALLYGLAILVRGTVGKQKESAFILAGFLFLSATVVNDVLDANGVIQTSHFVPAGVFIFIFSHAALLSYRYTRVFATVTLQRADLEKANVKYEREVVERQHREEELRSSEERYRTLYEDNPSMYFTVNLQGKVLSVNRFGAEQLGYTVGELVGSSVLEIFYAEDRPAVIAQVTTCVQHPNQVYHWEFRKVHRNGELLWVREHGCAVQDHQGYVVVLIVCENITAQRKAAEALAQYHHDLEERSSALKSSNEKLRQEIQERAHAERELKHSQEELRNLSAHLERLREEERIHISREIHDELGQVLSTLNLNLGTLENQLPKDQKSLLALTKSMSELIHLTLQRVKKISQELRPSVLDHLTFPQAVSWQIEEFRGKTGISCELAMKNIHDLRLAIHTASALFRVLQEALTNIVRHAGATQVRVDLERMEDHLILRIQDNGKGITQEEMADSQSFGLIGMRERIRRIEGTIAITGSNNQGTTIVCTIPWKA
ncbi:MAG: 7TM diverse intracellular signaling domain-containing protein [bacterium]